MLFTVLLYIFVAVAVLQILYYLFFTSFLFHKDCTENVSTPAISLILCAKNEEKHLKQFVPKLLDQNYSNFELLLINDSSTDSTLEVMEKFKDQDPRIKIVNVESNETFWGNKKYALTLGIKAASYEHLVFTDADCSPLSKYWLQEISKQFSKTKTIVLGYGKYETRKFSLVNLLVRYETLLTAIQYFSYATLGIPYMGVGRNLAYKRGEFFKVKGFINHMHTKSGDDDLFVRDAATSRNVTICSGKESHTISSPPNNFTAWFRQKRRHISTASHYKFKHKFLLSLFFLSKFLFWLLVPFVLIWIPQLTVYIAIGGYIVTSMIVIGLSSVKLQESNIIYFLPFLEIFLILFQITIFIANSISKPTHWK